MSEMKHQSNGQPVAVDFEDLKEKLGISYPSVGTISRKCYFSEGNAKSGIKSLPKFLQDKVEIVKYVPKNYKKEELPLFDNQ